jgi:4-hydroxy-3-polyprenylbenzoate decarboxylase
VVTQDPDDGWINLGTYHRMLMGKDKIGLHMSPGRHGSTMHDKCFERGVPFKSPSPSADPALFSPPIAVTTRFQYGRRRRRQRVEVIEAPYTKLPVPAHAEIIIEGECHPTERQDEGPFGEWAGYYANNGLAPVKDPVIHVKSVLFRNNPILTCAQPARPPGYHFAFSMFRSAMIWDEIEKAGVPDVRGVWCHEAGAGGATSSPSSSAMPPCAPGRLPASLLLGVYIGRHTWWSTTISTRAISASGLGHRHAHRSGHSIDFARRSQPRRTRWCRRITKTPAASAVSPAVIDACWPYEWKDRAYRSFR